MGRSAPSRSPRPCTVITNSPGLASQAGRESQGNMTSFHLVLGTYLPFALACSANLLMLRYPLQISLLAMLLAFHKCKGFCRACHSRYRSPVDTGEGHFKCSQWPQLISQHHYQLRCKCLGESTFYQRTDKILKFYCSLPTTHSLSNWKTLSVLSSFSGLTRAQESLDCVPASAGYHSVQLKQNNLKKCQTILGLGRQ